MLSSVSVLIKLLKFSLVTALSIAVVLFAISNKHAILVALWPFNLSVEVPVYLLCLGILARHISYYSLKQIVRCVLSQAS